MCGHGWDGDLLDDGEDEIETDEERLADAAIEAWEEYVNLRKSGKKVGARSGSKTPAAA